MNLFPHEIRRGLVRERARESERERACERESERESERERARERERERERARERARGLAAGREENASRTGPVDRESTHGAYSGAESKNTRARNPTGGRARVWPDSELSG